AGMKTASSFLSAGWGAPSWELRDGQYPLLRQMLRPVLVIADDKTATYSGSAFTAFTSTIQGSATAGVDYTGTVIYTTSTPNPTNAGTYTITPGGIAVTAP